MINGGALTLEGYKNMIAQGFKKDIRDPETQAAADKYLEANRKDIEDSYKYYLEGSKMASPNAMIYELDLEFVASEWA